MEITTTEAVRRIWERHMVGQVEARRVLTAGLAGQGRRVGNSVRYDEEAVAVLLDRPRCRDDALDEVRPLIGRLGRGRDVRVDRSWREIAEIAKGPWYLPYVAGRMLLPLSRLGPERQAFVATVASWVVFGAEIVGAAYMEGPRPTSGNRSVRKTVFRLEPPGAWFDRIEGTWLPLEHGPTLTLWGTRVRSRRVADSRTADYIDEQRRLDDERRRSSAPVLRELFQAEGAQA